MTGFMNILRKLIKNCFPIVLVTLLVCASGCTGKHSGGLSDSATEDDTPIDEGTGNAGSPTGSSNGSGSQTTSTASAASSNVNLVPSIPFTPGAGTIGLRNFRQLNATLLEVTGLNQPGDPSIGDKVEEVHRFAAENQFRNSINALPADGDPLKVSAGMILEMVKLTSVYCFQAIRREFDNPLFPASRRVLFKGYTPTSEATLANPSLPQGRDLVRKMLQAFLPGHAITTAEEDAIVREIPNMKSGSNNDTRMLPLAICTVAGSSILRFQ